MIEGSGVFVGGAQEIKEKNSLKEFETQDGHRYAITRDANGNLGFSEIIQEKEGMIKSENISMYQLTEKKLLLNAYEELDINNNDLSNAMSALSKDKTAPTKEKEEEER